MTKMDLTQFDKKPEGMINYLQYNGPHFNEKLCAFAISKMTKTINGREVPITPFTKKEVDMMLDNYGIRLENNALRDYVYVANMCKADFLGSSIQNETQLAKYVKDVVEDPDGYDGLPFTRFYADCIGSGTSIPWDDLL